MELILHFPKADQVIVWLHRAGRRQHTAPLTFTPPLTKDDQGELHWYLEVYPAHYTTERDDDRAVRIEDRLKHWGQELFNAVFKGSYEAFDLFRRFDQYQKPGRLISIDSDSPVVLAQPWELLHDPEGTWLFLRQVTIRRHLSGQGATAPFKVTAKRELRLLFVVSRPKEENFIDPRADPQAVMDAIDKYAPGRVSVEFLRLPTMSHLLERLDDEARPVDILHFDGHGTYDPDGHLAHEAGKALPAGFRLAPDAETGAHQGYLLFENEEGERDPIAASRLGDMLNQQRVGLVVLSACQSAKVGGKDPLGSVAASLIHAGIPTVLAMTHSVQVETTRRLFKHFYGQLGRGQPLGTALEKARRELYAEPERGKRRRANEWITLNLQDWFVPALYQSGKNSAFLTKVSPPSETALSETPPWGNLSAVQPSGGFWGRSRELWDIERYFIAGTRRLVVYGFGGQGKTYLAEEAGRWLHRTGLFQRVCQVGYADSQGVDPVGRTVRMLATVLDESLYDESAATKALARTPTLVILDNLETLSERDGASRLQELLDAACAWSEAGKSRVLLTTHTQDLQHPDFPTEGDLRCRYLRLDGLGREDALDWFQALIKQPPPPQLKVPPPAREGLLALFEQVNFHPLSIRVLARELKHRRPAELGKRLPEALLAAGGNPLRASLALSLDRLSPQAREWLPRLGVFQGGTFQDDLLVVTELTSEQWAELSQELEASGLIQVEVVPDADQPYLRFHPTLAPAMREQLTPEAQAKLAKRFRDHHLELSKILAYDGKFVHATRRAIARQVLPNLLAAVHQALKARDPYTVEFVDCVNWLLSHLGHLHEREELTLKIEDLAGETGSQSWYLVRFNQGEVLCSKGHLAEAVKVFEEILTGLDKTSSYNRCVTLHRLVHCHRTQGQPEAVQRAEAVLREAIADAKTLERSEDVKRMLSICQLDLGDVLMSKRDYDYEGALAAYNIALGIAMQQDDQRQVGVVQGQLGALELRRDNFREAEKRYCAAFDIFQRLNEPLMKAVVCHQLGMVYAGEEQWDWAEQAYRESARLKQTHGDTARIVRTYHELALVMIKTNKLKEAEDWFRDALKAERQTGGPVDLSPTLQGLANLLLERSERLDEARFLAEQALARKQKLDPEAAQIWITYEILAKIAERQNDKQAAANYRKQALAEQAVPLLIESEALDQRLECMIEYSSDDLVRAIRQGSAHNILCNSLDHYASGSGAVTDAGSRSSSTAYPATETYQILSENILSETRSLNSWCCGKHRGFR